VRKIILSVLIIVSCFSNPSLQADALDPFDPFQSPSTADAADPDKDKSPDELIDEATILFSDERPLDARTKLLRALQKDPKDFRAHLLLASYYMEEVGHFRLALKYVKQAQSLFYEKYGKPPYPDYVARSQHDNILYLLSQARLNLDDYQGSLDILDEYSSYGYYRDWYPGTRAWVLMKLGKIDDAIKVARLGIIAGAEPGRTLNMLGILLSMHDEREDALKIFRQAIEYELSLGKIGKPATPLNNAGEVYNEIFSEDMAESSWSKSKRLPDGCDHILPSLNLSLLYLDQNALIKAKESMDTFESCIAQFPLKNGEEHKALEHLIRGRIDLRAGRVDSAIDHLESALSKQQWFGKIGTSEDDLKAGALMSLAAALRAKNNQIDSTIYSSVSGHLDAIKDKVLNYLRARWLSRRARQVLSEDLNNLEDLYIRNTDSLLEYPTLGEVLKSFPAHDLEMRIAQEQASDKRPEADAFYKVYLAENFANHFRTEDAAQLLNQAIPKMRDKFDDALKTHALLIQLGLLDQSSAQYKRLSYMAYQLEPASIRNYGFKLPVNFDLAQDDQMLALLSETSFMPDNSENFEATIQHEIKDGQHELTFTSKVPSIKNVRIRAADINQAINNLENQVFSEDIQ